MQGIHLTMEWIRLPTAVETDCSTLIQALRTTENNRANWTGLISEIKDLSRLLPECKFAHTGRDANQVTHGLAQLAKRKRQCKVMRLNVTPEIQPMVERDVQ
jgi:hypothetical protein